MTHAEAQALDLFNELNELHADYGAWLDEDLTAEELNEAFSHGHDPEMVKWARQRVQEIQSQIDL